MIPSALKRARRGFSLSPPAPFRTLVINGAVRQTLPTAASDVRCLSISPHDLISETLCAETYAQGKRTTGGDKT